MAQIVANFAYNMFLKDAWSESMNPDSKVRGAIWEVRQVWRFAIFVYFYV